MTINIIKSAPLINIIKPIPIEIINIIKPAPINTKLNTHIEVKKPIILVPIYNSLNFLSS